MSSHYHNRIPTKRNWYVHDGYFIPGVITPEKIRGIYDSGHKKIYLSMGIVPSKKQKEYQKSLTAEDFSVLEGMQFEVVLIDSLNPPDSSIRKMFPSKYYIKGSESGDIVGNAHGSSYSYVFGSTWKETDFIRLGDFESMGCIVEEYRRFPECKYPSCRTYYQTQMTRKMDMEIIRKEKHSVYPDDNFRWHI